MQNLPDSYMWADQVLYFKTNDVKQYDFLLAYGHPGGPIIEGTIVFNLFSNSDYHESLLAFILFLVSIITLLISYLVFKIKNNLGITIIIFLILSTSFFREYLTPTSYLATYLFILQGFYSLYLFKYRTFFKFKDVLSFSLLSGLIMATRIDIGMIGTFFFGLFLLSRISMRDFIYFIFLTIGSFILFNPYMWYMPLQHISDLAYKFIYHYEFFDERQISYIEILNYSKYALFSFLLFLSLFLIKNKAIISFKFYLYLSFLTLFSFIIFFSSKINEIRYFVPILLFWESLIPFGIYDFYKLYFKKYV